MLKPKGSWSGYMQAPPGTNFPYSSFPGTIGTQNPGISGQMPSFTPNASHNLGTPQNISHPPSSIPPQIPAGMTIPQTYPPAPFQEQSYVENVLRMNLGKKATLYMTYENNHDWNSKIFKGVLEAAGRDHVIISDPLTGKRYLLLMLNLDYVTFDEPLNYTLPWGSHPPRQNNPSSP